MLPTSSPQPSVANFCGGQIHQCETHVGPALTAADMQYMQSLHSVHMELRVGLREERRRETDLLIRLSALELARDLSVDEISVEAICEKAGVSQRTFFNYLPYKEAAFVLPPPEFPEAAVATFLRGEGDLLGALAELFAAQALARVPERRMVDVSRRAAQGHSKIAALQFAAFRDFEAAVAGFIASRCGQNEPHLEHRIVAAAVLGALRVVIDANAPLSRKRLATAIRQNLGSLGILWLSKSPGQDDLSSKGTRQRQTEKVGR